MGKINKKITRKFQINKFKCEPMEKAESKQEPLPEKEPNNSIVKAEASDQKSDTHKQPRVKKSKPKVQKPKRNSFYMKCAKARQEKGMICLPEKIENKIYKLKKALQKKGLPGEEIKDIIRKKRREEELKMRKDLKQVCYKCREPGHTLANCPKAGGEEATDICYFCGSAEHRLCDCSKYKMSAKKDNLPFASCFICKSKGHLTRSCKKNENGVFPKGGKCVICGSVEHLVKDCSKNKDKEKQEEEIILQTIGDVIQSVDADDFVISQPKPRPKGFIGKGSNKKVTF